MRTTSWQLSWRQNHFLDRAIIGSFEHLGFFYAKSYTHEFSQSARINRPRKKATQAVTAVLQVRR